MSLTASKEAVAVFPVPGVPVIRTFGRFRLCSTTLSSLMIDDGDVVVWIGVDRYRQVQLRLEQGTVSISARNSFPWRLICSYRYLLGANGVTNKGTLV
jgi:hypothetical protein